MRILTLCNCKLFPVFSQDGDWIQTIVDTRRSWAVSPLRDKQLSCQIVQISLPPPSQHPPFLSRTINGFLESVSFQTKQYLQLPSPWKLNTEAGLTVQFEMKLCPSGGALLYCPLWIVDKTGAPHDKNIFRNSFQLKLFIITLYIFCR